MPSGIVTNEKNSHYEITYEHPWGGVASDAYKTDIAPNQFQQCDGLVIKDGLLCAAVYDNLAILRGILPNTTQIMFTFNIGYNLYCITDGGTILVYVIGTGWVQDQVNGACSLASCVQVIAGVAYIFSYFAGASFVYTPGISFVLGSNYVGGIYCCVLDQYLLTAVTNQPTDTPPAKANRINWSSPDGFTTWDPSIDRTAGFNVLADVQDYISAIFTMGNVGYVLRSQGLTQMSPTGVGIQPFDFTPLWSSEWGIGCTMPGSFAQYGPMAIWANDTNIYAFTGGGAPQAITGAAKKAIYQDLAGAVNNGLFSTKGVCATISSQTATPSSAGQSTPDLLYTLCILQFNTSSISYVANLIFWTYNINSGQWQRIVKQYFGSGNLSSHFTMSMATLYVPVQNVGLMYYAPCPIVTLYIAATAAQNYFLTRYQSDILLSQSAPNGPGNFNLIFKAQDLKIARQPNVRGVAILACASGAGSFTIHVNLLNAHNDVTAFSDVVVNSTTPKWYISNGMYTGYMPQLQLISNSGFNGVIIKVVEYGTTAEGELP